MRYEYTLKDHLGNARVQFYDENGVAKVLQENHYYAFGMAWNGDFTQPDASENKYLYNGKELQTDFGFGLHDYGARMYDPSIGRWNAIDPLAELYPDFSPYHYALNDPISFIDPDGMSSESFLENIWNNSGSGSTTWTNDGSGSFSDGNGNVVNESNDGWYEDENENVVYDPLVNSQSDVEAAGINGFYLGETTTSINEETGEMNLHNEDGTISSGTMLIPEGTVTQFGYSLKGHEVEVAMAVAGGFLAWWGSATVEKRGGVGGGGKSGLKTSRASKTLRNTKWGSKRWAGRRLGTRVVGGTIARAIPYVGWALLAADAVYIGYQIYQSYNEEQPLKD